MDSTRMVHSTGGSGAAAVRAPINPTLDVHRAAAPAARSVVEKSLPEVTKIGGYGLPCAKCRAYYLASLSACPICETTERVSASSTISASPVEPSAQPDVALNEERERFLREFKAKLYEAHMQINPSAYLRCTFSGEDEGAHDSATVCKTCFDEAQSRVDVVEAALHMDLQEAAQVIYDAVWADTSDSNKTYLNAAHALLSELRRRAGVTMIMGTSQSLPH
jgi:hypothetical protein